MMSSAMTTRVAELIDDCPNMSVHRAIELATVEVQAEQGAGHMALSLGIVFELVILAIVVVLS